MQFCQKTCVYIVGLRKLGDHDWPCISWNQSPPNSMSSAGLPSPWRIVASQHSGGSNGYERQKAMTTKMSQAGSRRSIQFPDVWPTNFIGFQKSSKWVRSLKYANDVVFCSLPCAWLAHGKWQNLGASNKTMGASPNCLATHRTEQLYRQEEETSPTPIKAQLSNLESTQPI